jgi:hypothetical protein
MGLLNDLATEGLSLLGVKTQSGVANPAPFGNDFPKGMTITEVIDGAERKLEAVQLVGRFAPIQPFEFGGEQRIVREEYPGSSEPTIQVLGPKEDEVTIKIEMRTNKFRGNPSLRAAAQEYQELIDAMRIRGNLVKIVLGEWKRYGFIKRCKFRLYTLQKIDAEITFEISGFNQPKGWRIITDGDQNVNKPNKEVTNAAASALESARNFPSTMPLTALDIFNNAIGSVADAVSKVTNFVDGIVDDADKLVGSANRAIGLIKNARATISRAKRNIGAIANNAAGLGGSFTSAAQGAINLISNTDHTAKTIRDFSNLSILLATLQARMQQYVSQVPFRRHLVRQGDTLQNVSMKYYNTADNWKRIYEHNKLSKTDLVIGSILEIPKA